MIPKKYLPFIIGYSIYASIVLISIANERHYHYWRPFILFLITIPLILGCIAYTSWIYYKREHPDVGVKVKERLLKPKPLFVEDWPLLDFARANGKMQVGDFISKDTNEEFKACIFTKKDGSRIFVGFFSQLGELTPAEISRRKDELKVGLMSNGYYYLHDNNIKLWKDINLE